MNENITLFFRIFESEIMLFIIYLKNVYSTRATQQRYPINKVTQNLCIIIHVRFIHST